MTTPDKLTMSRILLTFVFMFFLFSQGVLAKSLALFTFLIASFTDFLDGFLAKRNNQVTDFGKLMDPVADKILTLSAFLAFVEMRLIPAWMVVIVIAREVTITGLRFLAFTKGRVFPADGGGKHKMVSQIITILAILIFLIFREAGMKIFDFWNASTEILYRDAIFILMFITVILTLISGISYLVKNKEVYYNAKTD